MRQQQSGRPADCSVNTASNGTHYCGQTSRRSAALERCAAAYRGSMYRAALVLLKNASDAEDAVQEVFIKYLGRAVEFASEDHEKAWLMRVTVNQCRDMLRGAWRKRNIELTDIYPARDEAQSDVVEAILALPLKYRSVIHLFYYEGYSTAEIASVTSQKESTVRSLLNRARKRMRVLLEVERKD